MSDPVFDINQALGETYEYGGRSPLLPESYYPCILHVASSGTSEPKMQQAKGKGGVLLTDEFQQPIMEEGGDTPFVELTADVYEGPFAGAQVTRKVYITPGKTGRALGKWLGACHAITMQHAQTAAVCGRFGIVLPTGAQVRPEGKESPEQAFRRQVQTTIAAGFYAMDAGQRLAFVAALLNVVAWDGKRVVVKLGIEQGQQKKRDGIPAFLADGTPDCYFNNIFDGFLPLADEKKGLAWVRAVEYPKQEATKAAMDATPNAG